MSESTESKKTFAQISADESKVEATSPGQMPNAILSNGNMIDNNSVEETVAVVKYFSLPNVKSSSFDQSEVKFGSGGTDFHSDVKDRWSELGNGLKLKLNETKNNPVIEEYTTSMPLLEEHIAILPLIWKEIKCGDIITSGRTLRALAENLPGTEFSYKKKLLDKKVIYVINYERNDSRELDEQQRRVYATIIEDGQRTIFSYNTMTVPMELPICTVHYTSDEDVVEVDVVEGHKFYEVKILKYTERHGLTLSTSVSLECAIQCMTRKSKSLIVGFYDDTHVTLKLFSLDELIEKAGKKKYEAAQKALQKNLDQIFEYTRNVINFYNYNVTIKKDNHNDKLIFHVNKN